MRIVNTTVRKTMTPAQIKALEAKIHKQNVAYHEKGTQLVSDEVHDSDIDLLKKVKPDSAVLKQVGAKVRGNDAKVKLSHFLGSLDKVKPETKGFEKWSATRKHTGNYTLTDKLDGVSALLKYQMHNSATLPTMFTRGDGSIGRNISAIIPFVDNIPKKLNKDLVIRGELLMSKSNFTKNYAKNSPNPRGIVAGAVNSGKEHPVLKHTNFVAYELIEPEMPPSKGLALLKTLGFQVVPHVVIANTSSEQLSKALKKRKEISPYDIDGLVVTEDKVNKREEGNPKHAVAFKENTFVEAIVVKVHWEPSKYGVLIPRIEIKPQSVSGVTITYLTAHNASVIYNEKIGPGAIIKITRSGEVIPKLEEVIKPTKAQMPPAGTWDWDKKHVNIVLKAKNTSEAVRLRIIAEFFNTMGTEFVGPGIVEKLYNAGYTTIQKILGVTPPKLLKIEGFQTTIADKIYKSIQTTCGGAPLERWMAGSSLFGHGLGRTLLEPVVATVGVDKLLARTNNATAIRTQLETIPSFGPTRINKIITALPAFRKWFATLPPTLTASARKQVKKKVIKKGKLTGITCVFTGFRDADLQARIESLGGKVGTSITDKSILITKTIDSTSLKTEKAMQKGAKIMSVQQFIKFLG